MKKIHILIKYMGKYLKNERFRKKYSKKWNFYMIFLEYLWYNLYVVLNKDVLKIQQEFEKIKGVAFNWGKNLKEF